MKADKKPSSISFTLMMMLYFLVIAICVMSFISYRNNTYPNANLPPGPIDHDLIPNMLIGKNLEFADKLCEREQLKTRVVAYNGEHYMVTMDLRDDRVNLVIENGVITEAYIG